MTASGGDKASSPHFFSSSRVQPGGKPPGIFFAATPPHDREGWPLLRMRPPRGPSARPLSRALERPAAGAAPVAVVPARPRRWRAGTKKVCGRSGAGRAGAGPARPPPPQSQRPGLVRPRPVGPRRRWCGLVAGGGAPGPWSACVRSRCWPPGCGGPQPPRRGALPWWRWPGRWLRPPWRGVGGLACVRAPPAPNPTSPGGGPPSGPAAGWGTGPVPVPVP